MSSCKQNIADIPGDMLSCFVVELVERLKRLNIKLELRFICGEWRIEKMVPLRGIEFKASPAELREIGEILYKRKDEICSWHTDEAIKTMDNTFDLDELYIVERN